MSERPTVSVVMPAKNAGSTIADAIKSVLDQSFRDWELIVINDGSSDATESVVREYLPRDSRIRLLQTEGKGEPAARNIGLNAARGRWVAMLDADDMASPARLSQQTAFLERHPRLFAVASRAMLFVDPDRPLGLSAVESPTTMGELRSLRQRGHLFVFCHPTLTFNAEVLRGIGGYDESFFQACDAELVNRAVYLHGLPTLLMNEVVTWYRLSPEGMSSQGLALQRKVLRYLEERNLAWLRGRDPQPLQEYLARRIDFRTELRWLRHDTGAIRYRRAGILLGEGHRFRAILNLIQALILHPRYVLAKAPQQRLRRGEVGPGELLPPGQGSPRQTNE
jgi:glycosyltransferase involved in cell wall biosynthesis